MSSHAGKHGTLTAPSARAQRRTAAREEAAEKKKEAEKKKRAERLAKENKAPPRLIYQVATPFSPVVSPPPSAPSSLTIALPHVEPSTATTDVHWTEGFGHAIIEKQTLFVGDQCIDASRHCRICNRMYPCQDDDDRERRNRVRCCACADQTEFQHQQPMRAVLHEIATENFTLRPVADTQALWREKE